MKTLLPLFLLFVSATVHGADLLNGAGATFPYPLYSKWFSEYQKVDPAVQINYQSIGSGGGIRQLLEKTVDFGASDAPMTDEQIKAAVDDSIPQVLPLFFAFRIMVAVGMLMLVLIGLATLKVR